MSARQLGELGLTRAAVSRWVHAGRLHRLHRGVYAVGHQVVPADGHRLAAVLACGGRAAASHVTAAAIWNLRAGAGRVVHVTIDAKSGHRTRPGIRVHRSGALVADDVARVRSIPVTSVARTLADLGDVVGPAQVRSAFAAAERLRLIDMTAIDDVLERAGRRRRGARVLTELLRAYDPRWSQTRSDLELAMLDILAAHDLPHAEVNAWIDGRWIADFLWRDHGVIAEADSDRFHGTPSASRADARRDHDLRRLGYTVIRCSEAAIVDRSPSVGAALRAALATSARPS